MDESDRRTAALIIRAALVPAELPDLCATPARLSPRRTDPAKGIYSFSHLTFQEYFTAKYLVDNERKGTLDRLVKSYLIPTSQQDIRWREVFILTANLLDEADNFLLVIKERIDNFGREKLLTFLEYLNDRVIKTYAPHSDSASRALALEFMLWSNPFERTISRRAGSIASNIAKVDPDIRSRLGYGSAEYVYARCFHQDIALKLIRGTDRNMLSELLIYLQATEILLDCLNTECYISKSTREDIYDTLLTVI